MRSADNFASFGGHLSFGHASRKNLLSRQTQKYFDQRSLDFDHLRCKKNCDRLTLLPRLRQNFSQRSNLLCARQLLKNTSEVTYASFAPVTIKIFGWWTLVLRPRQSQKLLVHPGTKKLRSAVTCVSLVPVEGKFRSAEPFASVAPVAKTFGRVRRKNTSFGGHSCFSHLSCKNIAGAGHF